VDVHDDEAVRALHQTILDRWADTDAAGYAGCFTGDGSIIGFDGSTVNGAAAIEAHLAGIFADHRPAPYVGTVVEVRSLGDDVALLRARVQMTPRGASEPNPELDAVQSLVAVRDGGTWRAALFQNTPTHEAAVNE
jgi:uncharacterized protein (TIGR02246 family)